jgi:hypothetical protein
VTVSPPGRRSLTLAIAGTAAAMAACLPRGAPPGGRQVVADRQATLETIVPPNGDGALRILILKPGPVADSQDLYVVSVDAGGGPPSEQLLVSDVDPLFGVGCTDMVAPCGPSPAGLLEVHTKSNASVVVNCFTGAQFTLSFDPGSSSLVSASGDRFFVRDASGSTLYEPDASVMALDIESSASTVGGYPAALFVGEDFYYLTPEEVLMDLPPSGVPEQVATGIGSFLGFPTADGTLLLLIRVTSDPSVQAYSVRDPLTGLETVLPFSSASVQVSPDGNWLLDREDVFTSGSFTLFNYRTGAQQIVELPDSQGDLPFFPWRPGNSSQVWLATGLGVPPPATPTQTVWVVTPGGSPVSVPGVRLDGVSTPGQQDESFTPDGAHWFFTASPPYANDTPLVQVGAADDPTGPGFVVNPGATSIFGVWSLADGRLLTALYTDFAPRSDVFALDLQTGESVQLAERGRVAAVGDTRFVGMFHFDPNYRGDLTTVELDNGRQTILAPEFAVTAFVEPQGADLVPPGARVVYQFQARTDSPYDGIWVVTSP